MRTALRGVWRGSLHVVSIMFKQRARPRVVTPPDIGNAFIYRFVYTDDRTVRMLLLEHKDGTYGPPGGEMEASENSWQCAKREWHEETGYTLHMSYTELCKFTVSFKGRRKQSRVYLQSLKTLAALPAPGPPGDKRIGTEIRHIAHFSLPQLIRMRDDELPGQVVRVGARQSLALVIAELKKRKYK